MNNRSLSRNSQIITIVIVLLSTFKVFQSTPYEIVYFQLQAVFLALIFFFAVYYVSYLALKNNTTKPIVVYALVLMFIVPPVTAFVASEEFKQPFHYGLLAARSWLLMGVGIWFYYMLRAQRIQLENIEFSFVLVCWVSVIIYFGIALTFDPSQLDSGSEEGRVAFFEEGRGVRFRFENYFVTFGAIYYFIKYELSAKLKYLIPLSIFLLYIFIVNQGRTYILCLGLTFLTFYWVTYHPTKLAAPAAKFLAVAALGAGLTYFFAPEYLERMIYSFDQMFSVLGGAESEDISANSRITQSLIVFNYFHGSPMSILFGTGMISRQWNGGYDSIFGYFYPEDIGMLGGVFVYGIIGVIALQVFPIIATIQAIRRGKSCRNPFVITLVYILVYMVIRSLQGFYYFSVPGYVVPLFIVLASNNAIQSNAK